MTLSYVSIVFLILYIYHDLRAHNEKEEKRERETEDWSSAAQWWEGSILDYTKRQWTGKQHLEPFSSDSLEMFSLS